MEKGNSLVSESRWMARGVNTAHMPHTTIRLKILEPTTLLTARALLPDMAAVTLTASSGRLVPMATTVKPMMMGGTRSSLATAELPSTKKSAPLISSTKPMAKKNMAKRISCMVQMILSLSVSVSMDVCSAS